MTFHSEFRQGQTILIKLKDGRMFKDKYKERKSKFVITENNKIPVKNIQFISIPK